MYIVRVIVEQDVKYMEVGRIGTFAKMKFEIILFHNWLLHILQTPIYTIIVLI